VRRLLRDALGADVCLEKLDDADPFEYARGWLKRHRVAPTPAALRFWRRPGGLFRLRNGKAHRAAALGSEKPDPLARPTCCLLVSDELAVSILARQLYSWFYADPQQPGALSRRAGTAGALRLGWCGRSEVMVLSQFGNIDSLSRLEQTFSESGS